MSKKLLILGNGFTIDFLNQLNKLDELDVTDIFKNGENICWPENGKQGFLSYKYCPNMWNLGIRPYNDKKVNYEIFEDIITCANMANDIADKDINDKIYLKAYKELLIYLKFLFISFNKDFDFNEEEIKDWGWYKFFKEIEQDKTIESVTIATLNYDIFLELILNKLNIKYNVEGFTSQKDVKINIIKPHGSISFKFKKMIDINSFAIKYELENLQSELYEYELDYNFNYTEEFPIINALLPPAGDSSRFKLKWAETLKNKIIEFANTLEDKDDLVISGVSYWHVDRQELDKYLTNISENVNVYLINPRPSNVLNAVLTTIFKNVIIYKKSNNLGYK